MSKKIDRIAAKKKELEANIARLQKGMEENLAEVKGGVSQQINPTQVIRKYPIPAVGAAITLGVLLGYSGKKKSTEYVQKKGTPLVDVFSQSIKRKLAQKAIDLTLTYLDSKLAKNKDDQ